MVSQASRPQLPTDRRYIPALLISIILLVFTAALNLLHILLQEELLFIERFFLGLDYSTFYAASHLVMEGGSPYGLPSYVTPPLAALANVPLAMLPFATARLLVVLATIPAVALSYWLIAWAYGITRGGEAMVLLALGVLIILFSYPVYFLVDRGNIDAFVLLLLCLGIWLASRNRDPLAGVCFGLAMGLKIYPLLILVPLVLQRRWRAVLASAATLFLVWVLTPNLWIEYVSERLLVRGEVFRTMQNGSLANSAFYFLSFLKRVGLSASGADLEQMAGMMGYALFAILLVASIALDLKARSRPGSPDSITTALLYLPLMVSVPKQVYMYEFVILIALIPALGVWWHQDRRPAARWTLGLATVGVALTQVQANAYATLLATRFSQSLALVPYAIPSFGLVLVLVGVLFIRTSWLRKELPISVEGVA